MKTKANTLIEDGQDIKVKSISTDEIHLGDDSNSIKRDSGYTQIENKDAGIRLKDDFGNTLIINDEGYKLYVSGEKKIFSIDSSEAFFDVIVTFPAFTTALRPTYADEGAVIYDSTLKKCILYNGTAWVNLDGTALE